MNTPPAHAPTRSPRIDGWTPERQRAFVEELAQCGSVRKAAAAVGMSASTAYRLRARPQGRAFRAAWDAAQATSLQVLADSAMERATYGETRPLYSRGELVGEQTVFDNRLAIFLMNMHAKVRFQRAELHPSQVGKRDMADVLGEALDALEAAQEGEPPSPPRCDLRDLSNNVARVGPPPPPPAGPTAALTHAPAHPLDALSNAELVRRLNRPAAKPAA